jgi:hypothetical protein
MTEDRSDLKRVIQNLELESALYIRQLNFTLAGGSAAGLVALLNFAGGRKDSASVLVNFAPSYMLFLFALICCGLAVFFKSRLDTAVATHYAASHNRIELNTAIRSTPQFMSAPRKLAEEANKGRDDLIQKNKSSHILAEHSWSISRLWKFAYLASFILASVGFICGAGWPLFYVLSGGHIAD